MIRPKNETGDFLLSTTKNCEMLFHQIHTRPEETLEFNKIKPKKAFHFNTAIQVENDWVLGLIDLNVFNSGFNVREEN